MSKSFVNSLLDQNLGKCRREKKSFFATSGSRIFFHSVGSESKSGVDPTCVCVCVCVQGPTVSPHVGGRATFWPPRAPPRFWLGGARPPPARPPTGGVKSGCGGARHIVTSPHRAVARHFEIPAPHIQSSRSRRLFGVTSSYSALWEPTTST